MKKSIVVITIALLLAIGIAGSSAYATQAQPGAGAIWTTNIDCGVDTQDENHYAKGSWVYINGANFDPGTYDWFIEGQPGNASDDPNIKVAQGSFSVDDTGAFCFAAYQVQMDDGGEYKADFDGKKDNYRVERGAASILISIESCEEADVSRTSRSVSLVLTGASLTIGGTTYTSSTTIQLEPGSYPYEWSALPGYSGSGSGTLSVPLCEEDPELASVSIELGECEELSGRTSTTSVTLNIVGAVLTIDGSEYSSSTTISLAPGSYSYTWDAQPGYSGSGSGLLVIADCSSNETSSIALDLGECTPDGGNSSYRTLSFTLVNTTLTINGLDYSESTEIKLSVGSYPYSWLGLEGASGQGVIDVVPSASCLQVPESDPTPTPTSSPTTGSDSSISIFAVIGAMSLLTGGTSLALWRRKAVEKSK